MNLINYCIAIICMPCICMCESQKYKNSLVYNVMPTHRDHLTFLKSLEITKYMNVQFWVPPRMLYNNIQILVAADEKNYFEERLRHFKLTFTILEYDLKTAYQRQNYQKFEIDDWPVQSFTWEGYHLMDDIYKWMEKMADTYPTLTEIQSIGKSNENKDLLMFSIKHSVEDQPIVLVEAGVHGNEWITIEFATYLINNIINIKNSQDRNLNRIAFDYHWYIIPILNPDGFEYSQTNDYLWRKNIKSRNGNNVTGVDLDRNYGYNFQKYSDQLTHKPNSEYYCGPEPFSEPESTALGRFVLKKQSQIKYFFSIHAYGQMLVLPYSDKIEHLDNYYLLENLAHQAATKIYRYSGQKYYVGTYYDTQGLQAFGDSMSYMKKLYKIQYSMAIYLRDNGTNGFPLPSKQIIPACKEGMMSIQEIMTAHPKRMLRSLLFRVGLNRATLATIHPVLILMILATLLLKSYD